MKYYVKVRVESKRKQKEQRIFDYSNLIKIKALGEKNVVVV